VLEDVNRDYAPRRLIGALADVYAKLLPHLSTPSGEDFVANWMTRLTDLNEQRRHADKNLSGCYAQSRDG
jgi:hypothetical protein